jgi:hypothetical protein
MVETLAGGPVVREHRERVTEAFRGVVVGRIQSEVSHASPLAAEGVLRSVMSIVHTRLIAREQRPLIELLGPLMGVILGPFMDEGHVAREIDRGEELARKIQVEHAVRPHSPERGGLDPELSTVEIPALLRNSKAERARLCLLYIAEQDGLGVSPSNQQVGEAIGVVHSGQVAGLLGRLAGLGLLAKRTGGAGHANAWSLTPLGERVSLALAKRQ